MREQFVNQPAPFRQLRARLTPFALEQPPKANRKEQDNGEAENRRYRRKYASKPLCRPSGQLDQGSCRGARRHGCGDRRPARLSVALLRRDGIARMGAVEGRDRPQVAGEDRQPRRLHLHCRRVQSRADRRTQERARLRLQRMEQQAGGVCWLWWGRRCACDRTASLASDRAADGADPYRRPYPLADLRGREG